MYTDVFFGSTRDKLLDRADPDLVLSPVVVQFGKFMKVVIVVNEHEFEMNQPLGQDTADVMTQANVLALGLGRSKKTLEV